MDTLEGYGPMAGASTSGVPCRFLYSLNGPPSPEVLTAVRAVLQALTLMSVALVSSGSVLGDRSQKPGKDTPKVNAPCFPPSVLDLRQPLAGIGMQCKCRDQQPLAAGHL